MDFKGKTPNSGFRSFITEIGRNPLNIRKTVKSDGNPDFRKTQNPEFGVLPLQRFRTYRNHENLWKPLEIQEKQENMMEIPISLINPESRVRGFTIEIHISQAQNIHKLRKYISGNSEILAKTITSA